MSIKGCQRYKFIYIDFSCDILPLLTSSRYTSYESIMSSLAEQCLARICIKSQLPRRKKKLNVRRCRFEAVLPAVLNYRCVRLTSKEEKGKKKKY
jgi:hypothetical protein